MTPGEAHVVAIEDVLEDLGEALSYVPDYFVDKWFDGSREATVKKHRDALTRGLAPDRTAALETLLAALRAETDRCERCRANHQAMLGCFMHGWALTILMPDASRWVNNVPPGVIEAHAILPATPEPAPVADGTVLGARPVSEHPDALQRMCDELRALIESERRAAVARAGIDLETARMVIAEFERVLTVDNVARALSNVGDGVCPSSCPDEAHHREDAAAFIAALTEDVP